MFDYQAARLGADQHSLPLAWLRRLGGDVAESFRVLARLQYDEPWRQIAPARVPGER